MAEEVLEDEQEEEECPKCPPAGAPAGWPPSPIYHPSDGIFFLILSFAV